MSGVCRSECLCGVCGGVMNVYAVINSHTFRLCLCMCVRACVCMCAYVGGVQQHGTGGLWGVDVCVCVCVCME